MFLRFLIAAEAAEPRPELFQRSGSTRAEFEAQDRKSDDRSPSAPRANDGAIFLVSCVAEKRTFAAPARDLYISDWFLKARRYVEQHSVPWFILSAEYGLVLPDQFISPYERTLNMMSPSERRHWTRRVIAQILEQKLTVTHVTFLAGARYREFLVEHFRRQGITVEIPMEGLRIGKQLSYPGRT